MKQYKSDRRGNQQGSITTCKGYIHCTVKCTKQRYNLAVYPEAIHFMLPACDCLDKGIKRSYRLQH